MKIFNIKLMSLIVCFVFSNITLAQFSVKEFDQYVDAVMKSFEVPGISVAIVKEGKVILAKGYGRKKMGENIPVDENTLFNIASNTKAFTATALAILVEEGKLEWEKPVINYLPSFRLSNPYVTDELTVKDLLVHRSGLGLGAGDLLWWPASTYNRKEIVHRLQFIPLENSFRNTYAYDNVLYLVAGELIEAVTDSSWEDFIYTRILKSVEMRNSRVRVSDILRESNVASPHAKINEEVKPITPFTSDNTNPAGGILSNAVDMARWMIVQLDSGRLANGGRLFSPQTTRQLWTIVTPIPIGEPPPNMTHLRANFNGYALGFVVRDYLGKKMLTHTGGMPGYVSRVTLLPELKLGISILTNQESGNAFNALTYYVLDKYINAKKFDWVKELKNLEVRFDSISKAAEKSLYAERDTNSRPSLPLAKYMGTYRDSWYGEVVIKFEDDKPVIKFSNTPSLYGDLIHWQYDTFIARWRDRELRADAFVTFYLDPDGSIEEVKMRAVSPETDFSFDFHDLLLKPVHSKK